MLFMLYVCGVTLKEKTGYSAQKKFREKEEKWTINI